ATAGRLARAFDLRGSAMMIDTTCSSSLVALHQGCRDIQTGDAKYSVVAAAD
ncbi:MAG TPA: hypothetical protein DCR93_33265, partial [Cytophagales bacterium]|nr:hypothetical protein [Cytophagales bacterium]